MLLRLDGTHPSPRVGRWTRSAPSAVQIPDPAVPSLPEWTGRALGYIITASECYSGMTS